MLNASVSKPSSAVAVPESSRGHLTLFSGVGLVIADMVGVGVLTTTGFMARDLSANAILFAWLLGGVVAICGAVSYSALARCVPYSGGEYRYLSELWHPALGYIAGWASFLVGFAAPIAMAAFAAGAFAETLFPSVPARVFAAGLVIALATMHVLTLELSKWSQNFLAALKFAIVVSFIALGIWFGTDGTVAATQASVSPSFGSISAFGISLIYVSFSYSGWNAAVYAAEEFKNPKRDVPRSMAIGVALVTVLYLCVNFVFVRELGSEKLIAWTSTDVQRITLAHVVVEGWLGSQGGHIMSGLLILLLASSVSAMSLIGPRVSSAMASDGMLPAFLRRQEGKTPKAALYCQTALVMLLLLSQQYETLLAEVGVVLTLVSGMTAATVLVARKRRHGADRPSVLAAVCACVCASVSMITAAFMVASKPSSLAWASVVVVLALGAYALTAKRLRQLANSNERTTAHTNN